MTFKLKGRENEEAVLVTEDQTFVVRRGETSNTQMLFDCSIESLVGLSDVVGTKETRPRFPADPREDSSSTHRPPSTPLSTSTPIQHPCPIPQLPTRAL